MSQLPDCSSLQMLSYILYHIRCSCGVCVSQVLAKFLGLLTFYPNWGISASDGASTRNELPLANTNKEVCHKNEAFMVVLTDYRVFVYV